MTRIAVAWHGRRRVVVIDLLSATAKRKNRAFQKQLDMAVALFPPHPTVDVENWMAWHIMGAFGGGRVLERPKEKPATGDIMRGDIAL